MNTKQVAAELKTDARVLRRFLRADASYRNAGPGGRYEFTEKDMPALQKRFNAWVSENATRPRRSSQAVREDDDTMPASILGRKLTRTERTQRDAISRARVDRLEAALRASGLHIRQIREREELSA